MKRIFIYLLLIVVVSACKKDDEIAPGDRPDERLAILLNDYQQKLAGSQNGWYGYLFPEGGGGYTFHFKFSNNNRVTTTADLNNTTATTPLESSYRLKATQLPSLLFDTYTYLHIPADPDPLKSGGQQGAGLVSDFEFSILSATEDTIRLKGNLNGSNMILVRAKTADNAYVSKTLTTKTNLEKIGEFTFYYNLLAIGTKEYNLTINPDQQTVSFYYNDGGFKRFTTEFATTPTGIFFKEPFVDGNVTISEFHDINVSVAQRKITLTAGTITGTTTNVTTPLAIDLEAPNRMYDSGDYFFSDLGFTKSGVKNADNVTSIPGYQGIAYYPKYVQGYDALIFQYNNTLYAPAFQTRLTPDGKMTFYNYVGDVGTFPATGTTPIVNTFSQFRSTSGYYVFQTGDSSYDLVSVANSRNWIRFY